MNQKKRRFLGAFLALCMVFTMLPATALAEDVVLPTYILTNQNAITITQTGNDGAFSVQVGAAQAVAHAANAQVVVTSNGQKITQKGITVALGAGVTEAKPIKMIMNNLVIDGQGVQNLCAVSIGAGAKTEITLRGTNDIASGDGFGGIDLADKASVSISGEAGAKLTVKGGAGRTTDSGDMEVTTGNGGPGIGTASASTAKNSDISITITGGDITAIGRAGGAGIGGGVNRTSGKIAISGGTITASGTGTASPGAWGGESGGAGIGGGYQGKADDITITGGTITANGGGGTDAIGGGNSSGWGNVKVTGGTLTLTGGTSGGAGLYGNITLAAAANVTAYSDGTYPAIYYKNTPGAENTAKILNVVLKQRDKENEALAVTVQKEGAAVQNLTLPAKYKGFAQTVADGEYTITAGGKTMAKSQNPYDNKFTPSYEKVEAAPYIDQAALLDTVFVSAAGSDLGDGSAPDKAVQTMAQAYKLLADGGTVVVVGDVNVNPGWQRCVLDAKTATITGKTADADYAGKIIIDSGMDLGGNTTFKNIGLKFDSVTSYYHLFANGHDLTIDEGVNVEMWPGAEIGGTYYPPMARIYGGSYNAPSDGNVNITVKSGTFSHISAGGYGADATGDATITITGTASVTTGISGAGTGGSRTGNRVLHFNAGTEQAPVTVKWMECFDQININGGALMVAPGEGDKLEEIGNLSLAQGAVLGFANGEAINGNFAGGGKLNIASGKTFTVGGAVSGQTELVISGDAASGTYVKANAQGQAEGGFTTAQQGVTLTKEQNGEAASWVVTSETALPTITQDLAPQTPVTYGQDVVLTVAAVGANSYQWQKAPYDASAAENPDYEPVFSDLEGETRETLTLTKPGISGGVYYRCVVKNANGEVPSSKTLVTVDAAQVTITVQNQVIAKGEALPAFTYKVSGLLDGDALITPPSISAPDGANQTAGSYEITAQGADAGENYTIAYLPGTLVVTEEPLAVSVKVTDQAKDFAFSADENQIKSAADLSGDAATADVTGIALELSITDGQGDAATQAQDLAEKLMAENEKAVVGSPIDIALWKTVSISGAAQTPVALGEMKQPVAITLTLPASLVGKKNYGIVRVSGGIAESLPVTLSGMDITFETDHFSYFFLTYEEPSGGSSGSSTSWYTVVFKSNGGSAVSSQRVRRGFLVSQPKNPTRSGYTFDGWYSDPNLRYAYDFSDPLYGDLTLYAKWKDKSSDNDKEDPDEEPEHKCDNFTDIARHWAKDAICYVTENGLFEGMTKTTFAPDGTMTRAMFVTVMGRLSGTKGAYTDKFYDVPDDAYYAKYVGWAVNNGIVLGMDEHTFAPNEPITREQMAALMYRFAEYNGNDVSDTEGMAIYSFEDYDNIAPWARVYVRYCLNAGLLQGRDNGCFDPQADATRAEVATILQRFMKKIK